MRALLPLLFLAAVVAAAVWLLLADPEVAKGMPSRTGEATSRGASKRLDPAGIDAAPADTVGPAAEASAAGGNAAARSRAGRHFLVVGPDGEPVAGAEVWYRILDAEDRERSPGLAAQLRADPNRLPELTPEHDAQRTVTDARGVAPLPTAHAGFASVSRPGLLGRVFFEPRTDEPADEILLRLERVRGVSVRVVHADGAPAPGWRVHYLISRPQDRADPSPFAFGAWSAAGTSAPTGDDGRTWSRTEVTSAHLRHDDVDPAQVRHAVGVGLHFQERVLVEIDPERSEEVEIRLPAFGGMRITWQGFPSNVLPVLQPAELPGWSVPRLEPTATDESQVWSFDRLPLGREFTVAPLRPGPSTNSRGRSWVGTIFDTRRVPGPVSAGEVVEHTLTRDPTGSFVGRLQFPDGTPPSAQEYEVIRALAFTRSEEVPGMYLHAALGDNGAVTARLNRWNPERVAFDEIEALWFEVRARVPGVHGRPATGPAWFTEVALDLAPGTTSHDFGASTLADGPPLLRVRTTTEDGRPVAGARVDLSYLDPAFDDGMWMNASPRHEYLTDEHGRVTIVGRHWPAVMHFGRRALPRSPLPPLDVVRVTVSHRDYARQQLDIPSTQREATLVLAAPGSVRGAVVPNPWLPEVSVGLMPIDQPAAVPARTRVRLRSDEAEAEGKAIPFEVTDLLPGMYRLVVALSNLPEHVLVELPRVQILPGEATQPPALQPLDPAQHLDWLHVRVQTEEGRWLDQSALAELRPMVLRFREGGGYRGTSAPRHEGTIVLPLARGSSFDGALQAKGYERFRLDGVAAGQLVWVLREMRDLTYVFDPSVFPDGVDAGLNITGDGQRGPQQQAITDEGHRAQMPGPGRYLVRWFVRVPGYEETIRGEQPIEVDRATLDSGEPMKLQPPADLLARVRAAVE